MAVTPRLLFVVNDAGFFLSHRLPLALGARDAGFDVHIATAPSPPVQRIVEAGLPHHPIRLSRGGTNPFYELGTLLDITRLLRSLRPDVVHLVTPKPILYGGLAARFAGTPSVVAAVSGLGHVFTSPRWSARLMRPFVTGLYRLALGRDNVQVIFQNPSDRATLMAAAAVTPARALTIRGSGVDLNLFRMRPEPAGTPVVTFAARLLAPKGVHEFVAAAAQLKAEGIDARYQVVGDLDPDNPTSVSAAEVERWRREGVVDVLGYRRDLAEVLAGSHLVVLPSYREGLPKVLVEAAAAGRAVVTTDVPGCRDAIEPGVSGVLVPPGDSAALGRAMADLLTDPERRQRMGRAGRSLAEREYGIDRIVSAHLDIYRSLVG